MADHPTRQDTFLVKLHVDGRDMGVFDKKTGGALDSNEVTYRPGNMGPRLSLGGITTPANVVVQREYDRVRDHDSINYLLSRVGRKLATVSQKPLDFDGNPYGKAVIWHGTLKRVSVPDVDSEGNAAAMLEVEITVSADPTAA